MMKIICTGVMTKIAVTGALAFSLVTSNVYADDIKIGFLGGFTGPLESLTPPIHAGAKLAVTHVNAQGGILGGKLEMPTGDSTCADATAASNAADRMVNSLKVTALVGPMCSGATIAAANNAAVPGGMTMISPSATSPALTTLDDNDLVYRTAPSDAYQGDMMAKLFKAKGINNVAITYVNNDYGKGFAEALEAAIKKQGGKVAANEAHEDGKADYRAEIGSLASSGAETLVVLAYVDGSGQTIIRQSLESGDFTKFVGGDGMVGGKLIEAIGAKELEGMIATKAGTPALGGTAAFDKLAAEANIDAKAVYAAQAYDAAFLLAMAIQKNGSADRKGVSAALREVATAPGEVILPGEWKKAVSVIKAGKDVDYQGAAGDQEFDKVGDVPGVIIEMLVKDGNFLEVGIIK